MNRILPAIALVCVLIGVGLFFTFRVGVQAPQQPVVKPEVSSPAVPDAAVNTVEPRQASSLQKPMSAPPTAPPQLPPGVVLTAPQTAPPALGADGELSAEEQQRLIAESRQLLSERHPPGVEDALAKNAAAQPLSPRQLLQVQRERVVAVSYDELYAKLSLTDKEREQLQRALSLKNRYRGDAAYNADRVSDPAPNGKEPVDPVEGTIKRLLGEERYEVYQEYEKTVPSRQLVEQLKQRLAQSGTALAETDETLLFEIIVEEQRDLVRPVVTSLDNLSEMPDQLAAYLEQKAAVDQRIVERAGGVLGADQLQALQQLSAANLKADQSALVAYRQLFPGTTAAEQPVTPAAP